MTLAVAIGKRERLRDDVEAVAFSYADAPRGPSGKHIIKAVPIF